MPDWIYIISLFGEKALLYKVGLMIDEIDRKLLKELQTDARTSCS
ncbi:AsnC family protein [Leptolyngbya sp. 7M]|nr:AsnC family protein [Leptolyngbya sp. 7M]